MNQTSNLFFTICTKVSNRVYFQELMTKQVKFFDIQPYKINKLYSELAKKLYKQICYKYQHSNQFAVQPNMWHQNQRKIFIWFIVCYYYQSSCQDPHKMNPDWNLLSNIFFFKNCSFLKFQFLNIIKLKKRVSWTQTQDELLVKSTQDQGVGKWNEISKSIYFNSNCQTFKTPKHCRQRWLNHLDENKYKGKWTDEQDFKIFSYVNQQGRKWSKIVQILSSTRTQHMVKNRFNSVLTKNRKNKKQKQSQTIDRILKGLSSQLNIKMDEEQKKIQQKYIQSDKQEMSIIVQNRDQQDFNHINNISNEQNLFKKSSFSLSTSQTMSLMSSMNYSSMYSAFLPLSEGVSACNFDFLRSMKYEQIKEKPFFERQISISQFEQKHIIKNQINNPLYKQKSVVILQHNFN